VAYQIDSKTVFRAGGGIFYEHIATFGFLLNLDEYEQMFHKVERRLRTLRCFERLKSTREISPTSRVLVVCSSPPPSTSLPQTGMYPRCTTTMPASQRELGYQLLLDVS
jgi:hypothetical protein